MRQAKRKRPARVQLEALEARVTPAGEIWDSTFDGDGFLYYHIGYIDYATEVVQQPDGKYLLGGAAWGIGSANGYMVRLNSDGSFDPTFDEDGVASVEMGGEESGGFTLLQPDGKVIWIGNSDHFDERSVDVALVRYTSAGAVDESFGFDGFVNQDFGGKADTVHDAVFQGTKILVLSEYHYDNVPKYAVRRYSANGQFDTSFGVSGTAVIDVGGGGGTPQSLAVQADGKIMVAGSSDAGDVRVARLNANGSIDTTFGGGDGIATASVPGQRSSLVTSVIVQADGQILTGGYGKEPVAERNDFQLIRFDENGVLDPGLNGAGTLALDMGDDDYIYSLAQQANGKIVAVGQAGIRFAVARLNLDGTLDESFDDNGLFFASLHDDGSRYPSIVIQDDGKYAIAGKVAGVSNSAFSMMRLIPDEPQPPTADAGGPYSVLEGGSVKLDGSATADPTDPQSKLTFAWDLDNDGVFGETGAGAVNGDEIGVKPTFSAADLLAPLQRTVRLRVTDPGGLSDEDSAIVTVAQDDPVANAGGPYSVAEGGSVQLDGSASTDGVDPQSKLTFAWDLDGDGVFGEAGETGVKPTFSAVSLDGPQQVTVSLRVTDTQNQSSTSTAKVGVTNVAPVAGVSGPSDGLRGLGLEFTFSGTDAGSDDQAAGFGYSVNWGDGQSQQVPRTEGNAAGVTLEHVYANSGAYTVTVTATDRDGAVSKTVSHKIAVAATLFSNGVLSISGTSGRDTIQVTPGSKGAVNLRVNTSPRVGYIGVSKVVMYGWAGNDVLQASTGAGVAVELYGGAGNDSLRGGIGPSILDGEDGNDQLTGGAGRDVLIGGTGVDSLKGNAGDDVLVAGTFMAGRSQTTRRAALQHVQSQWLAATSYSDRTAALSEFMGTRVRTDASKDTLTGAAGLDWFFAQLTGAKTAVDKLSDRKANEFVVPLN